MVGKIFFTSPVAEEGEVEIQRTRILVIIPLGPGGWMVEFESSAHATAPMKMCFVPRPGVRLGVLCQA